MPDNMSFTFDISDTASLQAALIAVDVGGADAGAGNTYTFNFTKSVTLTQQLYAVNLTDKTSTLTINGNNATLSGNNQFNGLFVYNGTVAINDLTIQNAVAKGGNSGWGGGGAGLGGGLFVAGPNATGVGATTMTTGGNVTLTDVSFSGDAASGGNANNGLSNERAGGGGLDGGTGGGSSGGGVGLGAFGGSNGGGGGAGIIRGAASGGGGAGTYHPGAYGGGGGATPGVYHGGGVSGSTTSRTGGFGGGGGAANAHGGTGNGGAGGFGGGGGGQTNFSGVAQADGAGGFGGGGGGSFYKGKGGAGGFGAGNGGYKTSIGRSAYNGGGGLGAGADVFVQQGGVLTIAGGTLSAGTVTGGMGGPGATTGSYSGAGLGNGIFIQGNQNIVFTPAAGNTVTVAGTIADMTGSLPSLNAAAQGTGIGAGRIEMTGAGTLSLSAANTFTGGLDVTAGTVSAAHADSSGNVDALGSGAVNLDGGTLSDGAGTATVSNAITIGAGAGTIDAGGDALSLTGPITGAGDLTYTGTSGSAIVVTQDQHNGTTIVAGNVTLFGAAAGSFSSAAAFQVGKNANVGFEGDQTIGSLADGPGGGGTVSTGFVSGTLTISGAASTTFSGTLADGGFIGAPGQLTLVEQGGGSLTLEGTNTYTGNTTVAAASTLALAGAGSIADSGEVDIEGKLDISGVSPATSASIHALSGSGNVILGGNTLLIAGGGATFSGEIAGTVVGNTIGGLTLTSGTQTLSAAETYLGATEIDMGATLILSGSGSIANSFAVEGFGGTFDIASTTSGATVAAIYDPSGASTINLGAKTLTVSNTATGSSRLLSYSGTIKGTGTFALAGGYQALSGQNTYSGGTTLSGGTLDLAAADAMTNGIVTSGAAGTGVITFASTSASPARLTLETSAQSRDGTFGNVLASFGPTDTLDLKGLAYSGTQPILLQSLTTSGDYTLTVIESGVTETYTLRNPGSNAYYAHTDHNGGTLIDTSPVCFAAGTLIRTVAGDVAVEHLSVGDLVVTAAGETRPVKWMGHRMVDCRRRPRPHEVMPIRIAAHAFGENRPERDLFLSPQHAVAVTCLNEVLIPIRHLVNGATVAQIEVDDVVYWHVELDKHDILLAENLPSESFLDTEGRGFFDNGAEHAAAHPGLALKSMDDFCRPLIETGPIVTAMRAQLAARAEELGYAISRDPGLHLLVDGLRIDPIVVGEAARFTVPPGARNIELCSRSFVPKIFEHCSWDERRLGLPVRSIALFDGLALNRVVAIDDPALASGFHTVEKDAAHWWRWTNGRAALDASLWAEATQDFFLRVELTDIAYFRTWEAPGMTAAPPNAIDLAAYRSKVA